MNLRHYNGDRMCVCVCVCKYELCNLSVGTKIEVTDLS
jgi:hypothetical protein